MATEEAILFSAENAQTIAEQLLRLAAEEPTHYLELEIVSYHQGEEVKHPSLSIRLDSQGGKTTLADGSEIAHCHADDGRQVDLVLGKPAERELQPARVLVEPTQ